MPVCDLSGTDLYASSFESVIAQNNVLVPTCTSGAPTNAFQSGDFPRISITQPGLYIITASFATADPSGATVPYNPQAYGLNWVGNQGINNSASIICNIGYDNAATPNGYCNARNSRLTANVFIGGQFPAQVVIDVTQGVLTSASTSTANAVTVPPTFALGLGQVYGPYSDHGQIATPVLLTISATRIGRYPKYSPGVIGIGGGNNAIVPVGNKYVTF